MQGRPELIAPPAPRVVGRAEWHGARARLAGVEDELLRAREALAAARRGLPATPLQSGSCAPGLDLAALFEGRRQLVVVHLMFPPGADELCKGCAVVADGIAGLAHLASRDTTLVAVSRAPAGALVAAGATRGWTFPWLHCSDDFARELGFLIGEQERPGVAVLLRGEDGKVLLTYAAHGRSVEQVVSAYAWLDLTPLGRGEGCPGSGA